MAVLLNVLASGVIDNSGNPLDSGVVYVYEVGTTTPIDCFQDIDLTTPHTNPIILDSVGRAEVYVGRDVRIVIEDSLGTQIQDIDAIGTTTGLSGEIIPIGTTSADILELNASIEGDLLPVIDNTYDVGSTTNRWAQGHFVDAFITDDLTVDGDLEVAGDIVQDSLRISDSAIEYGSANVPNWINNLAMVYSGGTLTITDATGGTLSTTNPGSVTMSSTTAGLFQKILITEPATINDDAAVVSNFSGFGFGMTTSVDWANDVPYSIYLCNKANTNATSVDGTSKFFISRNPAMHITPSSANDIGSTAAIPVTDSKDAIIIFGTVTVANYINLPCRKVGMLRMQFATSSTDHTIQAFDYADGIGIDAITNTHKKKWTMPISQNGATAGKHMINGAGTAPTYTTETLTYKIHENGECTVWLDFNGNTAIDGIGAVDAVLALPYKHKNASIYTVGNVYMQGGTGAGIDVVAFVEVLASAAQAKFYYVSGTTTTQVQYAALDDGNRSLEGQFTYEAF